MDSHDPGHGDHPAANLQFRLETAEPERPRRWWSWKRRGNVAPRGIQIVDKRTGAPVAVVLGTAENAATIAHLFATSPSLVYGIHRAREQLRRIIRKLPDANDAATSDVRQLLREIYETTIPDTGHTQTGK